MVEPWADDEHGVVAPESVPAPLLLDESVMTRGITLLKEVTVGAGDGAKAADADGEVARGDGDALRGADCEQCRCEGAETPPSRVSSRAAAGGWYLGGSARVGTAGRGSAATTAAAGA